MNTNLIILILEAIAVYLIVLYSHSLRNKFGLYHFYALIGGLTAIMSWVTDAGIRVEAFGISFMVGSAVFYTALLLAVFIIYVFDGPKATRIAISTIIAVSVLVPIISVVINFQMHLSDVTPLAKIPLPSLRINLASVITTAIDLVFLAIAWEFFGNQKLKIKLWLRAYLTLIGVMILDVVLFNTGAFLGTPNYVNILYGTLISRLSISLFAFPFLLVYIYWQNSKHNIESETRPVFSILKQVAEIKEELSNAKIEIARLKEVENAITESLSKHKLMTEELGSENKMKELILDIITHDLKNPAGAIKGIADILKEEYPKDEMIEIIDQSVINLLSVIDNATTLAKLTGGEDIIKININLKKVIFEIVEEYKNTFEKNGIDLINKVDSDLIVNANPIIREIFDNYLSNALKYAYSGKKIIIKSTTENNFANIEFIDFGVTITQEQSEKIFLRNYQIEKLNYSGRGLGLSIVKRIADAHIAEVGVKPNSPQGNIFYLTIKLLN